MQHIEVTEPDRSYVQRTHEIRPHSVIFRTIVGMVLAAVNFDGQLMLRAIEIGYVFADAILTKELASHESPTPQPFPQSPLSFGLVLAKVLTLISS